MRRLQAPGPPPGQFGRGRMSDPLTVRQSHPSVPHLSQRRFLALFLALIPPLSVGLPRAAAQSVELPPLPVPSVAPAPSPSPTPDSSPAADHSPTPEPTVASPSPQPAPAPDP